MEAIPTKLKPAEIARFVHRANQLRQVKPAISYWCEYFSVNQILSKQLHTADEECLNFTTALMDRLEKTKAEHSEDDSITDDTIGQAYVEQFAEQTFERGEKVLRADRVTRQTADTFDAAATFFQLTAIWGPLDEETQKKIKFAKWNAARILRAIKEGKDPNETNPKLGQDEAALEEDVVPGRDTGQEPAAPPAPTVEDTEDAASPTLALPPRHTAFLPASPTSQLSSAHLPDHIPSPYSGASDSPAHPSQPHSPPSAASPFASPSIQPRGPLHFPATAATDSYTPPPIDLRPTFPGPSVMAATQPKAPTSAPWPQANPSLAPSTHGFGQQYPQSQSPANVPAIPSGLHKQALGNPPSQQQPQQQYVAPVDDLDIAKAEKHAKWAISALNFDDVPTAIRELRKALETLEAK